MTHSSVACVLLSVALFCSAGCSSKDKTNPVGDGGTVTDAASTKDAGATSISCYSEVQFYCEENPTPKAADVEALEVTCASVSGVFSKSGAACPPAGFLGKCTFTADGTLRVRRYYTGADGAYQQDFCVNTAQGTWSTTF